MKQVISFSVWGDSPRFTDSVFINNDLAKKHYPGWTVRAYHQADIPQSFVERMNSEGIETIPKPFYKDPWFGLYWRFSAMYDDPDIARFIVRDTDSRLSAREADAVGEWIAEGTPFHIMRDNMEHDIPILGGMWGAIPGCVPGFKEKMEQWIATVQGDKNNRRARYHGTDQEFLEKVVWPVIKNNHTAHISPYEHLKFTGREKVFRVTNPDGAKVGIRA